MQKLLDAAAIYPREWDEVRTRRTAWRTHATQVAQWMQEGIALVAREVPFFADRMVVEHAPGLLQQDEVQYTCDELSSVFVVMRPEPTVQFHHPQAGPLAIIENGFVLAWTPALNGEIVLTLTGHALAGQEPQSQQLKVYPAPDKISEAEALNQLALAFELASPTSVLFSRDPEPAPGTGRGMVGFRQAQQAVVQATEGTH